MTGHGISGSFMGWKREPGRAVRQGPERAAVIGLALYSLVWTWFLRQGHRKALLESTPWYPAKTHPSFQDALPALRRVFWR